MKKLEQIKARLGCLVPKPGVEMPSCHEHTLCDCESLMLVRCLEIAMSALDTCEGGDLASGGGLYKTAVAREALQAIRKEMET